MKSSPLRLVFVITLAGVIGAALAFATTSSREAPAVKFDPTPVTAGADSPVVVSYADVIEPVQAAVVSVYSTKRVRQQAPMNPLFRQFFGDQPAPEREQQGLGSGVIVTSDGFILTNNHVIEGADELRVALPDGREFEAKLVGSDSKTDVAVIKIEAIDLPQVTFADSDRLRVGDVVFAVGNPLGIGQTVTMGIVSALGRNDLGLLEGGAGYEDFIQTDAAINMGNSGGALIDARGRLVGINTAIISTTRGNIGIGFAIPANLAASIMNSLVQTGSVQRGFLGVQVDAITPELAQMLELPRGATGVVVAQVTPDGPAARAGIQRNDAILEINGRRIRSVQDLRLVVSQILPGSEIEILIVREGKTKTLRAELGQLDTVAATTNQILPGVEVQRVDEEARRRFGLPANVEGWLVTGVQPDSPHARQLAPSMVIVEINRQPAARDLAASRQQFRSGRNIVLVHFRGVFRFATIEVR
jgi:Do/DeqQ family serine protease